MKLILFSSFLSFEPINYMWALNLLAKMPSMSLSSCALDNYGCSKMDTGYLSSTILGSCSLIF